MRISGREARAELERCGVAPWRARRAVELGLAGDPLVTRGAFLYEADTVRALGARPIVPVGELRAAAPHGYVVAQLNVPAASSREELLAVARGLPDQMSALGAALLLVTTDGRIPVVITIAGFVVACADAVGRDARGWVLEQPGPWSATAAGGQLPTGKGRGWTVQEPWKWRAEPQSTSSAARRLS